MTKYLGVLLIVLGTIMLVVSYLSETMVDWNWFQFTSLGIILCGVVVHTILLKKSK